MKKIMLLICIGIISTSAHALSESSEENEYINHESAEEKEESPTIGLTPKSDDSSEDRLSYEFKMWHETDRARGNDGGDVTDLRTSILVKDSITNLYFRYEVFSTSVTKDASERERHNFRFGKYDVFTIAGFSISPYYQFRYEDRSKGGVSERYQHRIGYAGYNNHGWSFWGFEAYDSFNGRESTGGPDNHGYYGEHEIIYKFDLGPGVVTSSVFNEYQTTTYSSFTSTQAIFRYAHPVAEGLVFQPFTELDIHRKDSGRAHDYNNGRGYKNTGNHVYVAGVKVMKEISKSWSYWTEVSWSFIESKDDIIYFENGLSYKF